MLSLLALKRRLEGFTSQPIPLVSRCQKQVTMAPAMSFPGPWSCSRRIMSRAPVHDVMRRRQPHLPLKLPARDDASHNHGFSAPAAARTAL